MRFYRVSQIVRSLIQQSGCVLRNAGILHKHQNLLPGLFAKHAQSADEPFQFSFEQILAVQIGQHGHEQNQQHDQYPDQAKDEFHLGVPPYSDR